MDPGTDKHLLWIARAGLSTELPEEWRPCKSPEGEVYYFNFASGESTWDHPCDEEFRQLYREQRQLSIIAAQQRLAWTACTLATQPSDDLRDKRGRERRLAALKKRRGVTPQARSKGHTRTVTAHRSKAARPAVVGSKKTASSRESTVDKEAVFDAELAGMAHRVASDTESSQTITPDEAERHTRDSNSPDPPCSTGPVPDSPPGSVPPDSPEKLPKTQHKQGTDSTAKQPATAGAKSLV